MVLRSRLSKPLEVTPKQGQTNAVNASAATGFRATKPLFLAFITFL
jgi:hypothetical protein